MKKFRDLLEKSARCRLGAHSPPPEALRLVGKEVSKKVENKSSMIRENLGGYQSQQLGKTLLSNKTSPQPSPTLGEGVRSLRKDRVINSCASTVNSLPSCLLVLRKCYAFTLAEVLITLGIIGIVAAMTMPTLISKYKKHVVETKLKYSYSLLSQVVERAKVDHGDIGNWNFEDDTKTSVETYIIPYVKQIEGSLGTFQYLDKERYRIKLANGIFMDFDLSTPWQNFKRFITVRIDVNGDQAPNRQGRDRFHFYIFPEARTFYGAGDGNIAYNVPKAGIYYDGYGFSDQVLRDDHYRGCNDLTQEGGYPNSGYCIGIIVRNNWTIPKDYPIKL